MSSVLRPRALNIQRKKKFFVLNKREQLTHAVPCRLGIRSFTARHSLYWIHGNFKSRESYVASRENSSSHTKEIFRILLERAQEWNMETGWEIVMSKKTQAQQKATKQIIMAAIHFDVKNPQTFAVTSVGAFSPTSNHVFYPTVPPCDVGLYETANGPK